MVSCLLYDDLDAAFDYVDVINLVNVWNVNSLVRVQFLHITVRNLAKHLNHHRAQFLEDWKVLEYLFVLLSLNL